MNHSEDEKKCIRILAACFEQGNATLNSPAEYLHSNGLQLDNYLPLMRMMEEHGVISNAVHTVKDRYHLATITPKAVQLSRELDRLEKAEQEPRDLVAHINETVRANPVAAWTIVVLIVLTTLLTFVNQILQLCNNFGWISHKP